MVNDIVKMTEEENKIENNSVCKEGSFEVSTMIGYVNNSEIADGAGEDDVEVKNVMEDTEIDNNDKHMMLESEEDKEHRIAVIGQSLTISKLEDELAKELEVTFNVQNTEERIRRLKMVLDLLQKSDFTKKDTDIETDKLESGKSEKMETFVEKKEKEYVKSNKDTEDAEIMDNCEETKEKSVKKSEKHVTFQFIPGDEDEEISDNFHIDVSVADVVNRVILMGTEMDINKEEEHRIDNFYVNFPSSQSRAGEIIQKLEEEAEIKNYSPVTEDITDDETEKKEDSVSKEGTSDVESEKVQGGDNVIEIHKNESIIDEGNEEETPKKDTEEKSELNETQNTDEVKGKDTNKTEMNSDENVYKEDNKSKEEHLILVMGE